MIDPSDTKVRGVRVLEIETLIITFSCAARRKDAVDIPRSDREPFLTPMKEVIKTYSQ